MNSLPSNRMGFHSQYYNSIVVFDFFNVDGMPKPAPAPATKPALGQLTLVLKFHILGFTVGFLEIFVF